MAKGFKTLVCFDCSVTEVKVDKSTKEVICWNCVIIRLAVLRQLGKELFNKVFYKMPRQEGRELLRKILMMNKEKKVDGNDLRKARNKKGLSQKGLAGLFEVSNHTVCKMEKNQLPLNYKAIEFINRVNQ